MKVQVLYFDGCPTYGAAVKTLRKVLADEGVQAEVELVPVNTHKDARSQRFPGSPTIRVDGRDLFPAPEREDWRLGCRVYTTPEGLRGSPTAEMFEEALTKIGAGRARAAAGESSRQTPSIRCINTLERYRQGTAHSVRDHG